MKDNFCTMSLNIQFQSVQWPDDRILEESLAKDSRTYLLPDSESPASHKALIEKIRQKSFAMTDGHMGIGNIWMNLKILAVSRQSFGILADGYGPQVKLYEEMIAALASSRTKQDFKRWVTGSLGFSYFGLNEIAVRRAAKEISDEFELPCGVFYNDENFFHLQQLTRCGDLLSLYVNLFDRERVVEISEQLAQASKTIGTLYLTNLPWFFQANREFYCNKDDTLTAHDVDVFWSNIGALCNNSQTLVCDAQHEEYEPVGQGSVGCDSFHYVDCGTYMERRNLHLLRRKAYAGGNRTAFYARRL